MGRLGSALVVLALAAMPPTPAAAQSSPAPVPAAAIDPTALGVSLERISRRLHADAQARAAGDSPLKLEYYVDVYGTAPPLRFFTGEDLVHGVVPGGPPTHADMLYQMTPQLFRQPVVDFLGLAYSAAEAGARKMQDWRYQRDLRAYYKLVESGRNVPAPQPPRR